MLIPHEVYRELKIIEAIKKEKCAVVYTPSSGNYQISSHKTGEVYKKGSHSSADNK